MTHYVDPTRETFGAFRAANRDGPIHMLNLVRLRDKAVYADGHELAGQDISGAEAYASYGRESGPIFQRLGGRIVWRGTFELMLIGPADESERWDHVFVAEYPSVGAFIEMIRDPAYRGAVRHRQAAVVTSRLIQTAPADMGDGFG